ncbi:pentatricopeptide repeat domain-containing protein [Rutstroemia sp. NJR-2017a BBW]|nr:pentatricopeptide repeat domain-containing protein [Rutstroemia sp. NJR-2017a BBW]
MRSQLTRKVIRRLLSNEGLVFECPRRAYHFSSRSTYQPLQHVTNPVTRGRPQRRNLFGFSAKPERQPKAAEMEPGLRKMLDLSLMESIHARPPKPGELADAFIRFISHKVATGEAINNVQAQHCLRTIRYLNDCGEPVHSAHLTTALKALKVIPNDETDHFLELAREVYKRLEEVSEHDRALLMNRERFLRILCDAGQPTEARDLLQTLYPGFSEALQGPQKEAYKVRRTMQVIWRYIISGFARENNESEVLKTVEMMLSLGTPHSAGTLEALTQFNLSKGKVDTAKSWFSQIGQLKLGASPAMLRELLHFCTKHDQQDWAKIIFKAALETEPSKETWDVTFQWAAGTLGKGVEDVERMINVMISRYPDNKSMRPDVETINGLVELAMSKDDPYLAERYLSLGKNFNIRPNAKTYILQMDYRIGAGDLSGAQAAYLALQGEEILNNEDLPVINKYIRALCASPNVPYDRIVSITSDLEERKLRLEADTVSALCMMHLARNELDDVTDLLQVNVYHYTLAERTRIRDAFLEFCLDRNNDVWRVWDAYTYIYKIFNETEIDIRTRLMNEFFARKRSDMACHVFGHMRQHISPTKRPVLDTYIDCFVGIASCADEESLAMVHNMFKLDSSVEPNTRLYNALMLAYTACDDAPRSLHFWDDITNSREGPSYKSIEIVFQACQKTPFGDKPAREIWYKMRRMEIEITREVHAAYAGALAGQGKLDEVKQLIEGMEKDVGYGPDVLTIGTIYNAIQGSNRKDLVEEWAKELYPNVWKDIEKLGMYEHEEGHMVIQMPERELKA